MIKRNEFEEIRKKDRSLYKDTEELFYVDL